MLQSSLIPFVPMAVMIVRISLPFCQNLVDIAPSRRSESSSRKENRLKRSDYAPCFAVESTGRATSTRQISNKAGAKKATVCSLC